MNKLEKPNIDVKDVFTDCISNIRDKTYKAKLDKCIVDIISDTNEYEEKMKLGQVHNILPKTIFNGLTEKEMVKVYDNKMAQSGQPGRKYYDKIKSIPKFGICPYCGENIVSTLDHYLPKSKYISLIVTPSNLIPACYDCNKTKLNEDINGATEAIINPYFDNIENEIWLKAVISKEDDFQMTFYVDKPSTWNQILYERVKKHFEVFKLNNLYSCKAAQKLDRIKIHMQELYKNGSKEDVLSYLNSASQEYTYDKNLWQYALFEELLSNEWIYNEWLPNKKINTEDK